MSPLDRALLAAAAAALVTAGGAQAQAGSAANSPQPQAEHMRTHAERARQVSDMRRDALSVHDLLRGELTTSLITVGSIRDLVLNADGTAVEYVVIRSDPLFWDFDSDQFLNYSSVTPEAGASPSSIDLSADLSDLSRDPRMLRITADEAPKRLVSAILDSRIAFADGETHEIDDLLIDPQSGAVKDYVVNLDPGAMFASERRAVPADQVRFQGGEFKTDLTFADVQNEQPYDPALL